MCYCRCRAKVDIIKNKNCTGFDVERLLDIFTEAIGLAALSSSAKNSYLLNPTIDHIDQNIRSFILTIKRKRVNKTNKFIDDTEDSDYYIGTFTNKYDRRTLVVRGTLVDNITDQPTYYKETQKPIVLSS